MAVKKAIKNYKNNNKNTSSSPIVSTKHFKILCTIPQALEKLSCAFVLATVFKTEANYLENVDGQYMYTLVKEEFTMLSSDNWEDLFL